MTNKGLELFYFIFCCCVKYVTEIDVVLLVWSITSSLLTFGRRLKMFLYQSSFDWFDFSVKRRFNLFILIKIIIIIIIIMVTSQLTGTKWWSWIKACVIACIFCLSGFCCGHTPTPGSDLAPCQVMQWRRLWVLPDDSGRQWTCFARWLGRPQTEVMGQGKPRLR